MIWIQQAGRPPSAEKVQIMRSKRCRATGGDQTHALHHPLPAPILLPLLRNEPYPRGAIHHPPGPLPSPSLRNGVVSRGWTGHTEPNFQGPRWKGRGPSWVRWPVRLPHQPPPVPARKTQRSGATFRQAVFSAKEVPSAQDLSPRAQTHLPFGCSVVGVMWKPKASLNLQKKKNFHLSVCTWFLISGMSESATGPVVYALVCRLASVSSNSTNHPPKSFALFVTWL